jgi:hypothetical protein
MTWLGQPSEAEDIARELFGLLLDRSLSYNLEPWYATGGQLVRDARAIARGSGTCLDLALLYCAIAKSANLRPHLVVLRARPTSAVDDHAIVIIDTRVTARESGIQGLSAEAISDEDSAAFPVPSGSSELDPTWIAIDVTAACRDAAVAAIRLRGEGRDEALADAWAVATRRGRQHLQRSPRASIHPYESIIAVDVVGAHARAADASAPLACRQWAELPTMQDAQRPVIYRSLPVRKAPFAFPSREPLRARLLGRDGRALLDGTVVITGPSGSGKSLFAYDLAASASDGAAWFLNATDAGTLEQSLAAAEAAELGLDASGLAPIDLAAYAAAGARRLNGADGPWIVILDNAECTPADLARFMPVPSRRGQLLIITTTQPHAWSDATIPENVIHLAPLAPAEATAWLASEIGSEAATDFGHVSGNPLLLASLAKLWGNSPEAQTHLRELLLGDGEDHVNAAQTSEDLLKRMATVSFDILGRERPGSEVAAAVVAMLPPTDLEAADVAAALIGTDGRSAEADTIALEAVGLVEMSAVGTIVMHRLLRSAVVHQVPQTALTTAARGILLGERSHRLLEIAGTRADLDAVTSAADVADSASETVARLGHSIGMLYSRRDAVEGARWLVQARQALPDASGLGGFDAQIIEADCVQGVGREVYRSHQDNSAVLHEVNAELNEIIERLLPIKQRVLAERHASTAEVDEQSLALSLAASRAESLRGLVLKRLAGLNGDREQMLESLEVLERAADERAVLAATDSPDIDRSRFNIAGPLIELAKSTPRPPEPGAPSVTELLDRADSVYRDVYAARRPRYGSDDLEEVICCIHGRAVVAWTRAVVDPKLPPEERNKQLREATRHASYAAEVRARIGPPTTDSPDAVKSLVLLGKIALARSVTVTSARKIVGGAVGDIRGTKASPDEHFTKFVEALGPDTELRRMLGRDESGPE